MLDTSTLLIIDDCAADRKIYRRYLLKDPHQSYQIFEADCAEEGLALCQKIRYDVILLDFCLPDMSGLELFDRMQQEIFKTSVPVIMLTGRGDEEVAVQVMKRGALDYLVKHNVTQDVLQLAVRNAIKQSCLQAQLNKTQERQRLIATTALRIRQSLNLEQILNTAVAEVQQLLKCDRVIVYQFAPDTDGKIVASSVESFRTVALCDRVGAEEKAEEQGAGSRGKIPILCTLPHTQSPIPNPESPIPYIYELGLCNCVSLKEQFNTQANLVVPINLSNNGNPTPKLWGLLIAHQNSGERHWQTDDAEMLNEVSVQLAIAIQQAELLAQTQAALTKEKQLNTFKSQIIATVSHEYRTPLTSILAAASTLAKHSQQLDESKQERFLGIIEQKARYMSKLVDNMLLVNQFELEKPTFKPILLDLLQFFSDLIEQERETTGDRHELIFNITGHTQGFWGDRGLLQQIFINLMSNAIKYSPDGGTVEFHLIGKESEAIFYIQDRGIGIPIRDRENLFQSFSRGSNVDTIPGTGLGLAIAKGCVELHGGDITLSSEVGEGTKVTVSLPKICPMSQLSPSAT
ncbi:MULTISPECIES: hybrid sensor histidine kinase/response regulator [unclassified Nostoc]|uniref:hybrid sensor histidine kinase/response regulator n=1 Tax=unclassified Nostoc TaxID=2593658 RepID=UPI000CF327BD|nr:ATP-binding protein [Nostoc sp. 'Peltigera membranacea cyanobiont' N6]AVH64806.1 multi-sensor signal transduction histidine kinase [Nostoc sp. 'Peltigera membranacea cyanobiont' N6]